VTGCSTQQLVATYSVVNGMQQTTDTVARCSRASRLLGGAMLVVAAAVGLGGCGVVAFPVRTTSAAVKVVPVAGDVVAAPLDVTADTID
jgi:hypothetical protein